MNTVNTANALDLKCLSLNVRGLNKSIKRRTVFRWLHKQNHHIIFLQESYCSKDLYLSGKTNGVAKLSLATAQTIVKVS